jgi:O-antigen/teichoic acid export membrane protein
LKTQQLSTGSGTKELPKATQPLGGATKQLGGAGLGSAGTTEIASFDDEEEDEASTVTSVLAILTLVAACLALAFQVVIAKSWVDAPEPTREWSDYFGL